MQRLQAKSLEKYCPRSNQICAACHDKNIHSYNDIFVALVTTETHIGLSINTCRLSEQKHTKI